MLSIFLILLMIGVDTVAFFFFTISCSLSSMKPLGGLHLCCVLSKLEGGSSICIVHKEWGIGDHKEVENKYEISSYVKYM